MAGVKISKSNVRFPGKADKASVWPSTACPLMIWHKAGNAEPLASQEMERSK